MTNALEPPRWTTRRWIYTVAAVLAFQVAAVAVLVRRPGPPAERPAFATRVHLVSAPEAQQQLEALPGFVDPALFALPSLHGFSGSAWLRYPLLEHTPTERTESPEWLQINPARLTGEFFSYLSTNTISPPLLVDAPLPPVLRYEPNYSSEPVAPVSRLRIDGNLAHRPPALPFELRSWAHSEILSNTTVRAVVDSAGYTFQASIVSRSGLAAADDFALRLVENARFRPLAPVQPGLADREELTWGTFTFLWHTSPLPDTNTAPVLP